MSIHCLATFDFDQTLVDETGCVAQELAHGYDFSDFFREVEPSRAEYNTRLINVLKQLRNTYRNKIDVYLVTNRADLRPVRAYLQHANVLQYFDGLFGNPVKDREISFADYAQLKRDAWKANKILSLIDHRLDELNYDDVLMLYVFDDDQEVLQHVQDNLPQDARLKTHIVNALTTW